MTGVEGDENERGIMPRAFEDIFKKDQSVTQSIDHWGVFRAAPDFATIRIGQDILCLLYAGFLLLVGK